MSSSRKTTLSQTVTADDVARAAGVSRWTVTRAFKKDAPVSERSRAKVLEAAARVGYLPDLHAASLASDRSNLVALLVDDFSNPHKLIMLERLTRVLRAHQWDTLLVNTLDLADTNQALITASQRRVDAAILIGTRFTDTVLDAAVGAQRVKKLIVFARLSNKPNTISISVDDRAAMSEITAYVLEQGYQRPAFLAGPNTASAHLLRKETFLTQWQAGTGQIPEVIDIGAYDPDLAYEITAGHLSARTRADLPDILVCENDAIAMGAMEAIRHEMGLRIPEDIAVTGFDDIPQAGRPNYLLTTYRQPITAMAEHLLQILEDRSDSTETPVFLGQLVKRASA